MVLMALESGTITVGTAASIIPATCVMPWKLEIHNDDNTADLFLGGPGVTTATGMKLNKLERVTLELAPLDYVYAVSGKTGHSVSYIKFTRAC